MMGRPSVAAMRDIPPSKKKKGKKKKERKKSKGSKYLNITLRARHQWLQNAFHSHPSEYIIKILVSLHNLCGVDLENFKVAEAGREFWVFIKRCNCGEVGVATSASRTVHGVLEDFRDIEAIVANECIIDTIIDLFRLASCHMDANIFDEVGAHLILGRYVSHIHLSGRGGERFMLTPLIQALALVGVQSSSEKAGCSRRNCVSITGNRKETDEFTSPKKRQQFLKLTFRQT
jgi:hypothetical protein